MTSAFAVCEDAVEKDEAALRLARRASALLTEIAMSDLPRPDDADRFDWSSEVLDELARTVGLVGLAVERLADDPAGQDDLERQVHELGTAIVRRRNALLRRVPAPR